MRMFKPFLLLVPVVFLAVGCASSRVVNLTPTQLERNESGLYPVEAAWVSRDATIRKETLEPKVMVGLESYPMRPVPVVKDRWETLVPVPASKDSIRYRFKFDYEYNAIPVPRKNSKLSPEYKLTIVEPK